MELTVLWTTLLFCLLNLCFGQVPLVYSRNWLLAIGSYTEEEETQELCRLPASQPEEKVQTRHPIHHHGKYEIPFQQSDSANPASESSEIAAWLCGGLLFNSGQQNQGEKWEERRVPGCVCE
ncbi:hypothetical protein CHARACLAT_032635 [Characodon lateralis]|uniref:Uncharacterized protein n=1 Tax=Characodon lateralis TaxID=208331 RepID=A0ABU7D2K3_9TELE|nr:hypothetical protein [Characodon lateralis]